MKIVKTLLLASMLLAACGTSADTTPATHPPVVVDRTFDLTDPAVQSEVGSPPFEPVGWQRFVGPFTAIGDRELPNQPEVDLIAAAAADVPPQLAEPVRNIVRTAAAPPSHLDTSLSVAVALGPDVYLLDRVFTLEGGTTRYAVSYAINHEIAHVHQWFALDNAYLNAAERGQIEQLDLAAGSKLVWDFAETVGWENQSTDPLRPMWEIGQAISATPYGATNPAEDMAETIALTTSGRGNWLDERHRMWVESFANASIDELGAGQPWVPAGGVEINSVDPLYDEDAVAEAVGDRSHVEPTYFQLPAGSSPGEDLAAEVAAHLAIRGMAGSMEPIADDQVPRWAGLFERPDGAGWWVEVWDFPAGTLDDGPEGPIISYVMLW